MDAQRFDDLTRLIGSGATRRRMLGLIVGGLATLLTGRRSGRTQCVNPDVCQADNECCEGFSCDTSTFVCTEDLPEPCGFVGSPCEADADCCNSPCVGNICQCPVLGSACSDSLQCCSPADCINGVCALCREQSEDCADNAECCDGSCIQGLCHVEGQCLPNGSPRCRADFQCCDGLCNHNGICMGCFVRACTGDGDCCVGDVCATDGHCRPPCNAPGETCVDDADCCGYLGHACENKVCVMPPPCVRWGEPCSTSTDCCGNGVCSEGTCVEPCIAEGESRCYGSGSYLCCQGLECVDDTCIAVSECVTEGEACAADDCCADLVCTGGSCQDSDDSGEPSDDGSPDDEVTQLPDTGVGNDNSRALPGLASLAAGAAALLAGKKLRPERDTAGRATDEAS